MHAPWISLAEIDEILDLRWKVLRDGRPRWTARMPGDDAATTQHWAARLDGEVVACASVMAIPEPSGDALLQLRGMAVRPSFQRQGLGRILLAAIRDAVKQPMWCNARTGAVAFYRSEAWRTTSEEFQIPQVGAHVRMRWDGTMLLHQGQHLELLQRGSWEYVRRRTASAVVAVAAMNNARCLVLVEQVRPPVGGPVIELPAGLAGDLVDAADEPMLEAAKRELLEETGYVAAEWAEVASGPVSAGMSDEIVHVFIAKHLAKRGTGSGVGGERIVIHEVPLDKLDDWLEDQQRAGKLVDHKVHSARWFLRKS